MAHKSEDINLKQACDKCHDKKCVQCLSVGKYSWVESFFNHSIDDLTRSEQINEFLQEGKTYAWSPEIMDNINKYANAHFQLKDKRLSRARREMYQRIKNDFVKSLYEWEDKKARVPGAPIVHGYCNHPCPHLKQKPKSLDEKISRDLKELKL